MLDINSTSPLLFLFLKLIYNQKVPPRMTTITRSKRPLKVSNLNATNPYPRFRIQYKDIPLTIDKNLTENDREGLFLEAQMPILPYTPQDDYDRAQTETEIDCVVMENEFLRASFYPQYGGRLASLFSKTLNRELLFDNPTFQPANLALRNAWYSGGVEFNGPVFGHTMITCDDVYCASIETEKGPMLRIYEFDRALETTWQVDVLLDGEKLYLHPKAVNPNDHAVDYYWWTNIAVPCSDDTRILAPCTDECIHHSPDQRIYREGYPMLKNLDISYPRNTHASDSIFFDVPEKARPWIAAIEAEGKGVIHTSSEFLSGRKYFIWGTQQGSQNWMNFLAEPGKGNYLEIQAGITPTQLQTKVLPAGASFSWTECIMGIDTEPTQSLKGEYQDAVSTTEALLNTNLPQADFDAVDALMTSFENLPVGEVLHHGYAWGTLVEKRDGKKLSDTLLFDAPLGTQEQPWMELLESGCINEKDLDLIGLGWCTSPKWEEVLETAVAQENASWVVYLFLGVIKLENKKIDEAQKLFTTSIDLQASAHAYRCLAIIEIIKGNDAQALYSKAFSASPDTFLAVEISDYLAKNEKWDAFLTFYTQLDPSLSKHERIQLNYAQYAILQKDYATAEKILTMEFCYNRECETTLTDLWLTLRCADREKELGRSLSTEEKQQVKIDCPPPLSIDFIMD